MLPGPHLRNNPWNGDRAEDFQKLETLNWNHVHLIAYDYSDTGDSRPYWLEQQRQRFRTLHNKGYTITARIGQGRPEPPQEFAEKWRPVLQMFKETGVIAVQILNEIGYDWGNASEEEARWFNNWLKEVIPLIRQVYTGMVGCGIFGVAGTIYYNWYKICKESVEMCDFLACHEATWQLAHRQLHAFFPDKPILITELYVIGRNVDEQVESLQNWASQAKQDDYLLMMFIFILASSSDAWSSFVMTPELCERIKDIDFTNGGEDMPEFRFGVRVEADRLRAKGVDPGSPLTEEYWFLHNLAVQPTTTGQFWIHKVEGHFHVHFYLKAGQSPLS